MHLDVATSCFSVTYFASVGRALAKSAGLSVVSPFAPELFFVKQVWDYIIDMHVCIYRGKARRSKRNYSRQYAFITVRSRPIQALTTARGDGKEWNDFTYRIRSSARLRKKSKAKVPNECSSDWKKLKGRMVYAFAILSNCGKGEEIKVEKKLDYSVEEWTRAASKAEKEENWTPLFFFFFFFFFAALFDVYFENQLFFFHPRISILQISTFSFDNGTHSGQIVVVARRNNLKVFKASIALKKRKKKRNQKAAIIRRTFGEWEKRKEVFKEIRFDERIKGIIRRIISPPCTLHISVNLFVASYEYKPCEYK